MKRHDLVRGASIIFLGILAGPAEAQLTDGLVGYWPLDNLEATDASGNGLHGTPNGDLQAVPDRLGNPQGAIYFSGESGTNVDLGDQPEFQITGPLTLAAWVMLDSANPLSAPTENNGRIVAKAGGGGNRAWSLNIEGMANGVEHPATFQVSADGQANVSALGSTIAYDEWVHVAGVFRPGVQEVYLNGVLDVTNTTDVPVMQDSDNGLPVLIGARNACGNCGWPGAIDDVAIWNRDLAAAEVLELFESGLSGEFVRGDFNDDGVVNNLDFDVLSDNLAGHLDGPVGLAQGDINHDGRVDLADFGEFKALFPAAVAEASAIPEPSSLALALAGMAIVVLAYRQRRV